MKTFMNKFTIVTDKLCYYVNYFSMLTIIIMMFMVCYDVVVGNFMQRPVSGMYEICQVLLTTLVFSSWAYTQTVRGHIHVVMVIKLLPKALRFVCFGLTSLLSSVVMGFGTYAVIKEVMTRYGTGECTGTLQIPYWPFLIFEAIAFGLLAILLLRDAIRTVIAIWDDETAEDIQKDWV